MGTIFTARGLANIGCLAIVFVGLLGLFAGYPITSWAVEKFGTKSTVATTNVSSITNFPSLIDSETPDWALTRTSFTDGETEYTLVFSDEFNTDGRTFYPGDDPYWTAVDLHYWQTDDLEWYDPAAVTTANGSLQLTLSKKSTHGLDYEGGMVQTWNKFCFTGGIVETSVVLPGINNVMGLWPAVWTMGNLGRAGYGATLDGMWPYTYDACDVGTVANQTKDGLPTAATINGDSSYDGVLSYLGGQRLSRCTCSGESHPGPMHDDGTYVGRSAPEIDMFEAQITDDLGYVSQSGQFGPFNYEYQWNDTDGNYNIPNTTATIMNTYLGGVYQQAVSGVTLVDQDCYQLATGCFSVYAVEYEPGFDDAYITWVAQNTTAWTVYADGVGADDTVEISARPIPQEPMYILANLGISTSFTTIDYDDLTFPAIMQLDYIRVYQRTDSINIGCDPSDFPTADYINTYAEAYANPNLTTWVDDYGQDQPKNSFLDEC
ncbi:glycoside hydrolase family 16 protein [Stereum hirsutum FP-91666 SS1]|uniref:glycoside hydrolase family 16 protein n=1 Tax=Stereum hirsutum (strain FP-91666) TaxID=721885 RepID=UPI000444A308|nr:glycoside hydrolase family 16 protein [Stereum hirsutum FP-91666 SS1]EIM81775.1 glycoside hydrolase family 16 protein [Stereum hirsutum FP-91666 SS1]